MGPRARRRPCAREKSPPYWCPREGTVAGPSGELFRRIAINSGMIKLAQLEELEKVQAALSSQASSLFDLAQKLAFLDAAAAKELEGLAAAAGMAKTPTARVPAAGSQSSKRIDAAK